MSGAMNAQAVKEWQAQYPHREIFKAIMLKAAREQDSQTYLNAAFGLMMDLGGDQAHLVLRGEMKKLLNPQEQSWATAVMLQQAWKEKLES